MGALEQKQKFVINQATRARTVLFQLPFLDELFESLLKHLTWDKAFVLALLEPIGLFFFSPLREANVRRCLIYKIAVLNKI
jgi:hypothetical protein